MVNEETTKARTFSGTIWDTPEERQEIENESAPPTEMKANGATTTSTAL